MLRRDFESMDFFSNFHRFRDVALVVTSFGSAGQVVLYWSELVEPSRGNPESERR